MYFLNNCIYAKTPGRMDTHDEISKRNLRQEAKMLLDYLKFFNEHFVFMTI